MKNGFMNFAEWIPANKYIPSSAATDGRRNAATHVHRYALQLICTLWKLIIVIATTIIIMVTVVI